jgi:hypothetical protein
MAAAAKNNCEKIWTDKKMSVPLLRSSALLINSHKKTPSTMQIELEVVQMGIEESQKCFKFKQTEKQNWLEPFFHIGFESEAKAIAFGFLWSVSSLPPKEFLDKIPTIFKHLKINSNWTEK